MAWAAVGSDRVGISSAKLVPWALLAPVTLVFIGRSLDGTEQERRKVAGAL